MERRHLTARELLIKVREARTVQEVLQYAVELYRFPVGSRDREALCNAVVARTQTLWGQHLSGIYALNARRARHALGDTGEAA